MLVMFFYSCFFPVITGFYEIYKISGNMKHNVTQYFPCLKLLFISLNQMGVLQGAQALKYFVVHSSLHKQSEP